MNNIMSYLIGWKGYVAVLVLALSIGSYLGYKLRDVSADADYSKLRIEYSEYREEVLREANSTIRRVQAELGLHRLYIEELSENLQEARNERETTSYTLTEPLRNATDETDDTIGPALSDYLDRLRDHQRSNNQN